MGRGPTALRCTAPMGAGSTIVHELSDQDMACARTGWGCDGHAHRRRRALAARPGSAAAGRRAGGNLALTDAAAAPAPVTLPGPRVQRRCEQCGNHRRRKPCGHGPTDVAAGSIQGGSRRVRKARRCLRRLMMGRRACGSGGRRRLRHKGWQCSSGCRRRAAADFLTAAISAWRWAASPPLSGTGAMAPAARRGARGRGAASCGRSWPRPQPQARLDRASRLHSRGPSRWG